MRKFTFRRVPARAMPGLALAMSIMPCGFAAGTEAGSPPPTAVDEKAAAAPAVRAADSPDYYTRRASETVKQDEMLNAVPTHPLAAAYPEYTVVVCDGGCPKDRGAEIVFFARKAKGQVVEQSQMVPTSSGTGVPPALPVQSQGIDCLGGCYDTPKRYPARVAAARPKPPGQDTRATPYGGWVTTVTREGGTPEPVAPQR